MATGSRRIPFPRIASSCVRVAAAPERGASITPRVYVFTVAPVFNVCPGCHVNMPTGNAAIVPGNAGSSTTATER